ncbi:hypothetical protein CKQ90_34400, partial [Klebsiella pneumoniae]
AAALRGASLSGLSGSGAEDCRRRYQRAGAPARRGGSGADPPSRGRVPLLRSEARHYQDYLDLAQKIAGEDISERVRQLG